MIKVSPIFNKVRRKVAANYRPVSQLLYGGRCQRDHPQTFEKAACYRQDSSDFFEGRVTIMQLLTF